jgi:hypothetical protein
MHFAAEQGFNRMLNLAYPPGYVVGSQVRVLDVGGCDVNGTVHASVDARFPENCDVSISVMDIVPGPGVTIIGDATSWDFWEELCNAGTFYDLVISTEVLEHVQNWPVIVGGARRVLRDGGWFLGTCASTGRAPHGSRGSFTVPEGEWYANITSLELEDALIASGFAQEVTVEYSSIPAMVTTCDLYWRAQV